MVAASVAPSAVTAEHCLVAESQVEVTGTLDALRGGLRALILKPSAAVCLTGPAPTDAVPTSEAIQVYSNADGVMTTLMGLMGTTVRLKGRVFAPFAQAHRAPIMMEVSAAEPAPN
jgi:hypothetical protein